MVLPLENASDTKPQLVRGIGLGSATALNMIDMIGVGPFITIPLIVMAMGGPQAMLGWILGAVLAVCVLVAGCGTVARMTRAEGDGGWSAVRRAEEVARLAAAPSAEAAPAGPLTLAEALALAARGNRRIAEAEEQLDIARARVWETRGRLLPTTTGSGRYTWYTDAQTTRVVLPPGLLPAGALARSETAAGDVLSIQTTPSAKQA